MYTAGGKHQQRPPQQLLLPPPSPRDGGERIAEARFRLGNLNCWGCVRLLVTHLEHYPGIWGLDVCFERGNVRVFFDGSVVGVDALEREIEAVGFSVLNADRWPRPSRRRLDSSAQTPVSSASSATAVPGRGVQPPSPALAAISEFSPEGLAAGRARDVVPDGPTKSCSTSSLSMDENSSASSTCSNATAASVAASPVLLLPFLARFDVPLRGPPGAGARALLQFFRRALRRGASTAVLHSSAASAATGELGDSLFQPLLLHARSPRGEGGAAEGAPFARLAADASNILYNSPLHCSRSSRGFRFSATPAEAGDAGGDAGSTGGGDPPRRAGGAAAAGGGAAAAGGGASAAPVRSRPAVAIGRWCCDSGSEASPSAPPLPHRGGGLGGAGSAAGSAGGGGGGGVSGPSFPIAELDVALLGAGFLESRQRLKTPSIAAESTRIVHALCAVDGICQIRAKRGFLKIKYDPRVIGARYILTLLETLRARTKHAPSLRLRSPWADTAGDRQLLALCRIRNLERRVRKRVYYYVAGTAACISLSMAHAAVALVARGRRGQEGKSERILLLSARLIPWLQLGVAFTAVGFAERGSWIYRFAEKAHGIGSVARCSLFWSLACAAALTAVGAPAALITITLLFLTLLYASRMLLIRTCLSALSAAIYQARMHRRAREAGFCGDDTFRVVLKPVALDLAGGSVARPCFFVERPTQFERGVGPWCRQVVLSGLGGDPSRLVGRHVGMPESQSTPQINAKPEAPPATAGTGGRKSSRLSPLRRRIPPKTAASPGGSKSRAASGPIVYGMHKQLIEIGDVVIVDTGQSVPATGIILEQRTSNASRPGPLIITNHRLCEGAAATAISYLSPGDIAGAGEMNLGVPLVIRVISVGEALGSVLEETHADSGIPRSPGGGGGMECRMRLQRQTQGFLDIPFVHLFSVFGVLGFFSAIISIIQRSESFNLSSHCFTVAVSSLQKAFLSLGFQSASFSVVLPLRYFTFASLARDIIVRDPLRTMPRLSHVTSAIIEAGGLLTEPGLGVRGGAIIPEALAKANAVPAGIQRAGPASVGGGDGAGGEPRTPRRDSVRGGQRHRTTPPAREALDLLLADHSRTHRVRQNDYFCALAVAGGGSARHLPAAAAAGLGAGKRLSPLLLPRPKGAPVPPLPPLPLPAAPAAGAAAVPLTPIPRTTAPSFERLLPSCASLAAVSEQTAAPAPPWRRHGATGQWPWISRVSHARRLATSVFTGRGERQPVRRYHGFAAVAGGGGGGRDGGTSGASAAGSAAGRAAGGASGSAAGAGARGASGSACPMFIGSGGDGCDGRCSGDRMGDLLRQLMPAPDSPTGGGGAGLPPPSVVQFVWIGAASTESIELRGTLSSPANSTSRGRLEDCVQLASAHPFIGAAAATGGGGGGAGGGGAGGGGAGGFGAGCGGGFVGGGFGGGGCGFGGPGAGPGVPRRVLLEQFCYFLHAIFSAHPNAVRPALVAFLGPDAPPPKVPEDTHVCLDGEVLYTLDGFTLGLGTLGPLAAAADARAAALHRGGRRSPAANRRGAASSRGAGAGSSASRVRRPILVEGIVARRTPPSGIGPQRREGRRRRAGGGSRGHFSTDETTPDGSPERSQATGDGRAAEAPQELVCSATSTVCRKRRKRDVDDDLLSSAAPTAPDNGGDTSSGSSEFTRMIRQASRYGGGARGAGGAGGGGATARRNKTGDNHVEFVTAAGTLGAAGGFMGVPESAEGVLYNAALDDDLEDDCCLFVNSDNSAGSAGEPAAPAAAGGAGAGGAPFSLIQLGDSRFEALAGLWGFEPSPRGSRGTGGGSGPAAGGAGGEGPATSLVSCDSESQLSFAASSNPPPLPPPASPPPAPPRAASATPPSASTSSSAFRWGRGGDGARTLPAAAGAPFSSASAPSTSSGQGVALPLCALRRSRAWLRRRCRRRRRRRAATAAPRARRAGSTSSSPATSSTSSLGSLSAASVGSVETDPGTRRGFLGGDSVSVLWRADRSLDSHPLVSSNQFDSVSLPAPPPPPAEQTAEDRSAPGGTSARCATGRTSGGRRGCSSAGAAGAAGAGGVPARSPPPVTILEVLAVRDAVARKAPLLPLLADLKLQAKEVSDAQCACPVSCACRSGTDAVEGVAALALGAHNLSLAVAVSTPHFQQLRQWNRRAQQNGLYTVLMHANGVCLGGIAVGPADRSGGRAFVRTLGTLLGPGSVWLCCAEDFVFARRVALSVDLPLTRVFCRAMLADRKDLVARLQARCGDTGGLVAVLGSNLSHLIAAASAARQSGHRDDLLDGAVLIACQVYQDPRGLDLFGADVVVGSPTDPLAPSKFALQDLEWLFRAARRSTETVRANLLGALAAVTVTLVSVSALALRWPWLDSEGVWTAAGAMVASVAVLASLSRSAMIGDQVHYSQHYRQAAGQAAASGPRRLQPKYPHSFFQPSSGFSYRT